MLHLKEYWNLSQKIHLNLNLSTAIYQVHDLGQDPNDSELNILT